MTRALGMGVLMVLAVAAAGCGDDGGTTFGRTHVGSLSCSSMACGGDITGTWDIAGVCAEGNVDSSVQEMCPEATASVSGVSFEGSVTYNADGTGSRSGYARSTVRLSIPESCLMGASCSLLEMVFNDPEDPGTTASCTGGGRCNCNVHYEGAIDDTFTWMTDGNQIVEDGDTENPQSYCVEGNAAFIRDAGGGTVATMMLEKR